MKVLHFHPSMAGGGIEAMICGLANEMCNQGIDVTVGTIFKPKDKDVFWKRLSNEVNKFSLGKINEGFSLKELLLIYKAIKRGGYDVVNVHGFMYYYLIPILLLHRKIKFFYTVHSDASLESAPWDRKILPIKRFLFRHGWIKPITISKASNESFIRFYGCNGHQINNGVAKKNVPDNTNDIDKYRYTKKTKVFLHPGRIAKAKNQVMLCKAFNHIISNKHDVVLLIAGNNEDKGIFEKIEPFFSDRIVYLDERTDIIELMSKADGFCLSSIWEGLPVTLLESLSVGCIPICTPVGGIVDVIKNGYNGFLAKSTSETDYIDALEQCISLDSSDFIKMRQNCLDSFEPYNIKTSAKKYIEYYSE